MNKIFEKIRRRARAKARFEREWKSFIAFESGKYYGDRIYITDNERENILIHCPELGRYMCFTMPKEIIEKLKKAIPEEQLNDKNKKIWRIECESA